MTFSIRPAEAGDAPALWRLLEPVLRAGETYALPRDWDQAAGLAYWAGPGHQVFVASEGDRVVGSYFLCANQLGGGAHVANCGFIVAAETTGRGIARAMCRDALDRARTQGFRAMQFNFVIATNTRALALWQGLGFDIVGRLPAAFDHPRHGLVDAFVLYRPLGRA